MAGSSRAGAGVGSPPPSFLHFADILEQFAQHYECLRDQAEQKSL